MSEILIGAKYKFELGTANFEVELDGEIFAENSEVKSVLHYHALYEIYFVFEDEITVVYENGEQKYKNCIVCIPPGVKHFTKRGGDFRLFFSYSIKDSRENVPGSFFAENFKEDKVFCVPVNKYEMFIYLKELCYLFYKNSDDVAKDLIISVLKLIFFHIYLYCEGTYKKDDKKDSESYYVIISGMISRCTVKGENISLSSVSNALHLSKKHTARIIQKYYKKTLSEIICEEKLNFAAELLISSDMPVSKIAAEANFNSENYFYLQFKKKFGITPLKYREKEKL